MINFTTCANVANSFLKVLQGYTKSIRFIAVLTILCTIGVGNAWGADVTFLPNEFSPVTSSNYSLTKGNITVSVTLSTVTNDQLRIFKNQTLTISAANGDQITGVEFTCTASETAKYGPGCFGSQTGYSYSGKVGTWTGNASSVSFKATSDQVRATKIVVTYTSTSGGGDPTPDPTTYTIKWHTAVGTTTDVPLNEGETITQPATDPTMTGYEFMGWTDQCNVATDGSDFTALSDFGTADSDKDFYAVFAVAETTGGGGTTTETLKGSDLTYSGNNGYVAFTATTASGTWSGKANYNTGGYIQINKNANNYHIGSPTFAGNVESVKITTTNNSAANRTFYIRSSNTTAQPSSGDLGSYKTTAANQTFTIDLTAAAKQFYIYSSGAVYISQIDVTYGGGSTSYNNYITTCSGSTPVETLTDAQFAWSAATAEATMGASNTFPTLTNTLSVPVTYESSTPATATIAADGAITLVAPGTTTISAKFAGGEVSGTTYAAKTVTYSLTVLKAPANPTGTVYVKVTNTVTDGEYLIVYEDAASTPSKPVIFDGSLATLDAAGNMKSVTISGNAINGDTEIDAATFTISTMTGGYSIKSKSGKYIGRTGSDNGMNTNASSEILNNITISDGKITIAGSGDGSSTSLQYYSTSGQERFRYYKTTQKAIALYKKASSHTLTYGTCTNGSVSADVANGATVLSGTTITLSNTPDTNYKLSAYDVYKTGDATTKVTVADGKFVMPEFDVTISATFVPAKTLTSIEITTPATQTTFWQGETFNYTGLKVTAHFDGAADEVVTPTVNGSTATAGTQTVTVSYTEGSVTKFTTYDITVKATANTEETAYDVATAREIIDKVSTANDIYVEGIVSEIVTAYNATYGNISYNISADGLTTSEQLQAYRGKSFDGKNFTSAEDVKVGDEVIIFGNLLKYNDLYELAADNKLISLTREKVAAGLAYATTEYTANVGETFETPVLTNPNGLTVTYSTSDASKATVNATTGAVTIVAEGTVTITATFEGNASYYAGTASYTITISDPSKLIAELPFNFNGGRKDIESKNGMSQKGLDDDYASSPKLKFDGTGDYVIIHFNGEPGMLSYDIKGNSYSGGTFTVQQSENGETYTDVAVYTTIEGTQNEEYTLLSTSRYVKFIYTNKSSGNVGLGNITISKPDNRQEAGLAWNPETVTLTVGEAFTPPTLVNPYSVTGISYKTSKDAVATVTAEGVIALAGATGEATITATFDGNEDYKQAKVSCTITVNDLTTYTVTLNPNYPTGKTGTFIDKEENTVNGNLEISLPSGTATQPIADLYTSIALDGYIFEGWYDAASEGNYREKTGDISKDITFYAYWKVPYTVTFNAGTGTCTPSSITETTAKGITLPAATLTDCDDWTFLGWAETAIESETTTAPASFLAEGSKYKPTANITLYAIYKRVEGGGGESATLTFDDTSKRTTRTTNQQVWTENGITLTNNKSESTDTVAAYYNPVRFYKSSEIIIEAPGNITQIVATTSGGNEYTNALKNSVGAEAISSDNVVTITPSTSSNTYTINLTAGQTRLSSISVTYGGGLFTSYYHSTPLCQVTITYYGFGGGYTTDCETDPNAIVITKGDTYQIPNCEPTDYDNTLNRTFAGTWNTKANGKGTAYKPGDKFIVNSNITLYAQWALNTSENITLPTDVEDLATTDIVVTGGTTLTLKAGTTTINSLTLKGGLQTDSTYAMPVVNIPEGATLVRNNNKINLDLKVNNNSYYPFAVPFEVANTSENVNYLDTTLKKYANDNKGYGEFYEILEYNGALRAENGVNSAKNWVHVGRGVKLVPGKGYAISAVPAAGKDTVTIRITMSVSNAWLANGEQFQIDTITRNAVKVVAHKGTAATGHPRHAGWNFVANPYLSNFAGKNASNKGGAFINGKIIINNGEYDYGGDDEVPYVTIPTYNFAHYYQLKLSEATLSPAYSFFVQVGEGGTMSFADEGRQAAPASIAARNAEERPVKMDVDITLSDNHRSDATGLIICDRYNDEYEIGRDLEKMFGSAANLTVYTLMADNTPLAYQALAIRSSMQVIPVGYRAPEQGEYTFALNTNTSSIDLLNEQYEQLVLVDYQTGELTNLLIADYTFYSERVQSDSRFAIYAVPRQNAPTDLPNALGSGSDTQKVLHNGHLYILHNGSVYNGNGQIVK